MLAQRHILHWYQKRAACIIHSILFVLNLGNYVHVNDTVQLPNTKLGIVFKCQKEVIKSYFASFAKKTVNSENVDMTFKRGQKVGVM